MTVRMKSPKPARKVGAAALGAAIATLVLWLVKTQWPDLAIHNDIEAAITTVATFALGYFVPPSADDQVIGVTTPAAMPAE